MKTPRVLSCLILLALLSACAGPTVPPIPTPTADLPTITPLPATGIPTQTIAPPPTNTAAPLPTFTSISPSATPEPTATEMPTSLPVVDLLPTATLPPIYLPQINLLSAVLPLIPENILRIERRPEPLSYFSPPVNVLPIYNPYNTDAFQIDFRAQNLTDFDLTQWLETLMYSSFDTLTRWPPSSRMPPAFDTQKIMDLGRSPGLRVRSLHASGVTGRGVGIAIIDMPLLVQHEEYANQLRFYEESEDIRGKNYEAHMHGPSVASIAVGRTAGVAPAADLYYIGQSCYINENGTNDYTCVARNVRRVIEINQQLPAGRKIRVLSMSMGWDTNSAGYNEIVAAVNEARQSGLFVVSSNLNETYRFKFQGMGRSPLADPDQFTSYEPGLFWRSDFYNGNRPSGTLMIPMDSRAVASPYGTGEYVFYRAGGWSWSIPYIAGVYALAAQVKPNITPEEFWALALETGQTIDLSQNGRTIQFGPIIDPVALIQKLSK